MWGIARVPVEIYSDVNDEFGSRPRFESGDDASLLTYLYRAV